MSAFDIAEISACLRRIEVAESARGGGRRETNGGGVGSRQDALAEKPQDGGGGDGDGSKKEVRGWRRREVAPWKTSADRQLAWTRRGSADRQPTAARRARRPRQTSLLDLPDELLLRILELLDPDSRHAATVACRTLNHIWQEKMDTEEEEEVDGVSESCSTLTLDYLPVDVLLYLFKFLDVQQLGRIAQVCRRLESLVSSDSAWWRRAQAAFASNQLQPDILHRSQAKFGVRERVRLGRKWKAGDCNQNILTVHNRSKYMPRIVLEREALWVSWGKTIWCHPRIKQGGISAATTKMLRGHKDDVSKFVVSDGMVVSGGRDRSLFGWSARTGEFLFSRRYCHAGEISAVDVTGQIIVTGSRDKSLGVWALQDNCVNPFLVKQLAVGDRVWSLNICRSSGLTAVGTSATRGVPPLRLFDLRQGRLALDMGAELRNGAGMLDIRWLGETSLLSCGYDTCTRLWDTRCGTYVSTWEEPNDEAVYCLDTDGVNTVVTGTNRHGRVGVWDLRSSKPLYTRHATPVRRGQSSPVYSLAMDSANIYVALDQSLNHFGFQG